LCGKQTKFQGSTLKARRKESNCDQVEEKKNENTKMGEGKIYEHGRTVESHGSVSGWGEVIYADSRGGGGFGGFIKSSWTLNQEL